MPPRCNGEVAKCIIAGSGGLAGKTEAQEEWKPWEFHRFATTATSRRVSTEAELSFRFGTQTRRRRRLILRLRRWIELGRAVGALRLLVDGSFVTAKPDPDDVDAVMLVPASFPEQAQQGVEAALEFFDATAGGAVPGRERSRVAGMVRVLQPHPRARQASQGTSGDCLMISSAQEYEAAKEELSHLEDWLSRLQREHQPPATASARLASAR